MILTGPKENYCYIEVSREITGGGQFLGKVAGIAADVLGVEAVASTTQVELVTNGGSDANIELRHRLEPVTRPAGCEIPPANELRLVLMHRGFSADNAWRYPDTAYIKSKLRKANLRDKLTEIAGRFDQELSGSSVWFDEADFLPSPGKSLILGLKLLDSHTTTQVLTEQSQAVERELRQVNNRLFKEPEPWKLAMAVARVELDGKDQKAQQLLEFIQARLPERFTLGDIKFSSDDEG